MEIKIRIKGRTPMLMHAFSDEAAEAATNGTRASTQGDRGTPQEQCEQCLYTDEAGKIIMPQPNLMSCIIAAGKFHRHGKTKVTTQKSSLISAAIAFDEMYYPLEHEQPWKVDTRPVRIPATGGRILRHRPCFDDWQLEFKIDLDVGIITERAMRSIVDDAGKRIGLGDFRPDCKGPFGKFDVVLWEVQE